ncbi:hypothetical protein [Rhizohabitans arisaemae]|uniref:hypothetical protein n=1 Tax=Rhizohabitans arisaemae TaxID=2720610 RepID=UPI0024B0DC6F|nr:hypothetical protein [Rhizohabitans arisaemae]
MGTDPERAREAIIEEIMDALAFGVLGQQAETYVIERRPDGSMVAGFQMAGQDYEISISSRAARQEDGKPTDEVK